MDRSPNGIGCAMVRKRTECKTPVRTLCAAAPWAAAARGTGRPTVRPRTAAVLELRRHGRIGAAGIFLRVENGVRTCRPGCRRRCGSCPADSWAGGEPVLHHHQGIERVAGRAERNPIDRHDTVRTDARIGRAKEDLHRLAVDLVVARIIHRGRSVRRRERHTAPGRCGNRLSCSTIRQQMEEVRAEACRRPADSSR